MDDKGQHKDSTSLQGAEDHGKPMNLLGILVGAVDRIIGEENPFKCSDESCCPRFKNATRLIRQEFVSPNKTVDVFWNSDERRQLSKHKEKVSKRILQARGDYSVISLYVKRHELIADLLGILPLQKEEKVVREVPNGWKRMMKRRKIYRDISDWGLSDEEDYCCDFETVSNTTGSPKEIYQNVDNIDLVSLTKHAKITSNDFSHTESLCQTSPHKEKSIETGDLFRTPNKEKVIQGKSNFQVHNNRGITIYDKTVPHSTSYSSRTGLSDRVPFQTSNTLRQENFSNEHLETANYHRQGPQDKSQLTTKVILGSGLTNDFQGTTLYNLQLEKLNNLRKGTSGRIQKGTPENANNQAKEIAQSKVSVFREEEIQGGINGFSEQLNTRGFPLKDRDFNTCSELTLHPVTRSMSDENIRFQQTCSPSKDREVYEDTEQLDEDAILLILDTLLHAQRNFKNVVPSLNPEEFKLNIEKYMREKQKNIAGGEDICTEQDATKVLLLEHIVKFFESKIIEIVKFAKSIPGFRDLSLEDQASLIKVSRTESAMVSGLPGVNTNTGLVTTDTNGELPLDLLGSVISPTFLHEFVKIGRKIENVQVTEKESAILRGITLTFSDRCQLNEPQKVEGIQKKLVMCLQYVLERETTTVTPSVRMGQLLDILTSLRNYTDVDSSMLERCIQSYPNNHNDLVRE